MGQMEECRYWNGWSSHSYFIKNNNWLILCNYYWELAHTMCVVKWNTSGMNQASGKRLCISFITQKQSISPMLILFQELMFCIACCKNTHTRVHHLIASFQCILSYIVLCNFNNIWELQLVTVGIDQQLIWTICFD